jgi:hypothetical protein
MMYPSSGSVVENVVKRVFNSVFKVMYRIVKFLHNSTLFHTEAGLGLQGKLFSVNECNEKVAKYAHSSPCC